MFALSIRLGQISIVKGGLLVSLGILGEVIKSFIINRPFAAKSLTDFIMQEHVWEGEICS